MICGRTRSRNVGVTSNVGGLATSPIRTSGAWAGALLALGAAVGAVALGVADELGAADDVGAEVAGVGGFDPHAEESMSRGKIVARIAPRSLLRHGLGEGSILRAVMDHGRDRLGPGERR